MLQKQYQAAIGSKISPADLLIPNAVSCPPRGWAPGAVRACIDRLLVEFPNAFQKSIVGNSVDGCPIELIRIGAGSRRVLAWSQMHGDEQSYTTVVLNLLRLLVEFPTRDVCSAILTNCQLLIIPQLNPDGAVRRTRFNAQGIDINRDARNPATPEGRTLREVVLDHQPDFAFNLHNQCHRRWLPTGDGPIALSLLVPPANPENEPTASMQKAALVAACIARAAGANCDARVSRYGADYMPRAFGEWVQSQGVATVLLEAGGWPGGDIRQLEQLNLLAFVAGLEAIATDAYQ